MTDDRNRRHSQCGRDLTKSSRTLLAGGEQLRDPAITDLGSVSIMNDDTCHVELTTDCWTCGKPMTRFAQDSWYWYYRCEACGVERMYPKEKNDADMPEM
jgi:DNA-directed RNA polymerase subunit RPC12/RpoP